MNKKNWQLVLKWLHREFPARYPIVIRSQKLNKNGDTDFRKNKFYIRINNKTSYDIRIDTIIHEWAHALTWFGAGYREEHPDEWGLYLAKIYRAFLKWDYND